MGNSFGRFICERIRPEAPPEPELEAPERPKPPPPPPGGGRTRQEIRQKREEQRRHLDLLRKSAEAERRAKEESPEEQAARATKRPEDYMTPTPKPAGAGEL